MSKEQPQGSACDIVDGSVYLVSSRDLQTGEQIVGLYRAHIEQVPQLDSARVQYQTTTIDNGALEVLYEGESLTDAETAALEHRGTCSISNFRADGICRTVGDYRNGKAIKGYVYE